MKKLACRSIAFALVALLFSPALVTHSFAQGSWKAQWQYKGENVSTYDPAVKHYMWETARPPYGPWDKIALNRYVRQPNNDNPYAPAPDRRKVFFIIPGTWDRGYQTDMNPKISQFWYFAGQGYDVYTISFRTEYIPNFALDEFATFGLADALAATSGWTYGVFREDIKACVDFAKHISQANKIFMGGVSRGGTHMFIYASKYPEDLKGLVSFDAGGAYVKVDPSSQMTKAQFDAAVAALGTAGNPYLSEVDHYDLNQFAGAVPYATTGVGAPLPDINSLNPPIPGFAPADKDQMTYVSDLRAYDTYFLGYPLLPPGLTSDYYTPYPGGSGETYIDENILVEVEAFLTRYWPSIQNLEDAFMANYLVNPNLDYQNPNINLPLIFFASELSCYQGSCLAGQHAPGVPPDNTYQARDQSTDITLKYLAGYGHLDVFVGTHSVQDVKLPALQWMNERLGH